MLLPITHYIIRLVVLLKVTVDTVLAAEDCETESARHYGVDISYPMHYARVSTNYEWLPHNQDPSLPVPPEYEGMPVQPLGNRQAFYDDYMARCAEAASDYGICDGDERERLRMNLQQPPSMRNYTKMGFSKIKAPHAVFDALKEFWEKNKHKATEELWYDGNIITNHWVTPTKMVSVTDENLEGAGYVLEEHVWNAARDTIQEWTRQKVVECSMYGIRIYYEGAVLATHVDRLPLVASAIINVDQDVDEPWPLEVIGHDGKAYNVTMEPGDLVLYESHSILHGRPFPLKGRFMANVFIHFEPIGPLGGQIEYTGDLPPYLIPGSPEEPLWRESNPNGHVLYTEDKFVTGSTDAHHYASTGDLDPLRVLLDINARVVNVQDQNGWTPLHESVRGGHVEVTKFLLERGANVNIRTGSNGEGDSPLDLLYYHHEENTDLYDALFQLLEQYGAEIHKAVHTEL